MKANFLINYRIPKYSSGTSAKTGLILVVIVSFIQMEFLRPFSLVYDREQQRSSVVEDRF